MIEAVVVSLSSGACTDPAQYAYPPPTELWVQLILQTVISYLYTIKLKSGFA